MQDIDFELPKACLQNSQTCTSIGDRIQGLLEELRRKNPSGKKLMKLVGDVLRMPPTPPPHTPLASPGAWPGATVPARHNEPLILRLLDT